jgi:hypothetical protein
LCISVGGSLTTFLLLKFYSPLPSRFGQSYPRYRLVFGLICFASSAVVFAKRRGCRRCGPAYRPVDVRPVVTAVLIGLAMVMLVALFALL